MTSHRFVSVTKMVEAVCQKESMRHVEGIAESLFETFVVPTSGLYRPVRDRRRIVRVCEPGTWRCSCAPKFVVSESLASQGLERSAHLSLPGSSSRLPQHRLEVTWKVQTNTSVQFHTDPYTHLSHHRMLVLYKTRKST